MDSNNKPTEQVLQMPLRLWPGIVLVILQWLIRFGIPAIFPEDTVIGILGGLFFGLLIFIWWAFFSLAPRIDRWGAIILIILALIITSFLIDVSIATGGQGMMFTIFAIPVLCLAFVLWAVVSQHLPVKIRRPAMVITIFLACGVWTLFRTDGITGDFSLEITWRWAKTSEEKLLARENEEMMNPSSLSVIIEAEPEWPGFRGPKRDGVVSGVKIETDWSKMPPKELWRRSIGPGCSSFAVSGDFLFTQEQRGDDEIVACYSMKTGDPIWRHVDKARFWDSHAGAGPRSTPTLEKGRVYTLGATGILNVLDASDGTVVWSRNAVSDTDVKHSGWGYASSPLVVDDMVIVAAVGQLVAYDINTGNPLWFGPDGGDSYSSPHLLSIDGITQVLLMSQNGVTSLKPSDGSLLWEYSWPGGSRIVQPAMIKNGELLISNGDGASLRRIKVTNELDEWKFEDGWTSTQLKPNFNDFIIHKGYAYGYNGPMLTCIDAENGERKWKSGRFGGQIILLADQDLLLVLSEKGEVVLVKATPDNFIELSRIDAIEGKTWNHPVLVEDVLLVRNSQEMVAYELSLAGS